MPKNKTFFDESLMDNQMTYVQYLSILKQIAISMFEWKNLPNTVDSRYIEKALFEEGSCIYFNDEVMGNLSLNMIAQGNFDVYGEPIERRAFSKYNNYQKELDKKNSVIIWNNLDRTPSYAIICNFAKRLYNLDRIIDVNANAQKTPVFLHCDQKQRMSVLNAFKEMDGNAPVIYGDKNFDLDSIKCLTTGAPFVSDKLYELKANIWNEALTYLGIPNANVMKRERLIKDEVLRGLGGTLANRFSRLTARQEAVKKINAMFDLEIKVDVRDEIINAGEVEFSQTMGGDRLDE